MICAFVAFVELIFVNILRSKSITAGEILYALTFFRHFLLMLSAHSWDPEEEYEFSDYFTFHHCHRVAISLRSIKTIDIILSCTLGSMPPLANTSQSTLSWDGELGWQYTCRASECHHCHYDYLSKVQYRLTVPTSIHCITEWTEMTMRLSQTVDITHNDEENISQGANME